MWAPSTPTLPEQPSQHPNQLGRARFAPSTWVLLLGLWRVLEPAPTHRAGLRPHKEALQPCASFCLIPQGSLVSPLGFLTSWGDCHLSSVTLILAGSPVP